MSNAVRWACVMAAVSAASAAVVGVVVVDYVLGNPAGSFDVFVVPPAVVAAAVLGGALWWLLVERPRCFTDGRGVTVGVLVGTAAHPLTWLLYLTVGPLILPGGWSEPRTVLELTLAFAALSVLFAGMLTVAGGVLAGVAVMRVRRYLHAEPCGDTRR